MAEATKQRVTIIGPNLNKAGQDKGQYHVHAEGCGDIARDPRGYGYVSAEPHWTIGAANLEAVVEDVYADIIAENEGDEHGWDEVQAYMNEFHFAPCVTLGHAEGSGS